MRIIIILLALFPQFIIAQNITTIAGTGTAGSSGDGSFAVNAQLNDPQGLAVDAAGNFYITDLGGHRIRKVDISTGFISTIAGTGTCGYSGDGSFAVNAQICAPSSLAFDGNGDLYFTDRGNNRVRKINMSTGIIITVAGTGTGGYNNDGILATNAQLNGPNDVAFDANGNLFIADWFNNRVRKVDMVTDTISTIAGNGTAGYSGENVPATGQINGPCGIIFDRAGNIYIAEYGGARVRKITISNGYITTIAGNGTFGFYGDGMAATSAELSSCAYIRFDAAENMYIGDAGNQRVREITKSTGYISTVAGNGTQGYSTEGIPATSSPLGTPYNIYFDVLNCNMYTAEYTNNRIRKITGGFAGCPSPVAPGNLVSCQVLPAVTINNANKNSWVPVFDSVGNIAAEINANGNNLGTVSISLFTKTGACREDAAHRLYLNRNITITPQNQPASSTVSLRVYILKAELDSLKTAVTSQGQPSGVASNNDIDVFKNNDACATTGTSNALPLIATTAVYNSDYYFQVNISSFSSFYFANKTLTAILPVLIKTFAGKKTGSTNVLYWEANCNGQLSFSIERSADGLHFETIGNVPAIAADCNQPFGFTDHDPFPADNYYRLRIIEDGSFLNYSAIILLPGDKSRPITISITPDPVIGSTIHLQVGSAITGRVELVITDITGRMMLRQNLSIQAGSNDASIHVSGLAKGMYWLYGSGEAGRTNVVRLVKE